jgi:hypothetical protein
MHHRGGDGRCCRPRRGAQTLSPSISLLLSGSFHLKRPLEKPCIEKIGPALTPPLTKSQTLKTARPDGGEMPGKDPRTQLNQRRSEGVEADMASPEARGEATVTESRVRSPNTAIHDLKRPGTSEKAGMGLWLGPISGSRERSRNVSGRCLTWGAPGKGDRADLGRGGDESGGGDIDIWRSQNLGALRELMRFELNGISLLFFLA